MVEIMVVVLLYLAFGLSEMRAAPTITYTATRTPLIGLGYGYTTATALRCLCECYLRYVSWFTSKFGAIIMYRILTDSTREVIPDQDVQCILRIEDNASIPIDEANTDYQEYLAWLAEGNTPEEAE